MGSPIAAESSRSFPLLDHTKTCALIYSDEEREIFSTAANPDIDTAKLIHFAIGLFWKASAHSWKSTESEPAIALGQYQEALRLYLLGQAQLPADVARVISLDNAPVRLIGFVEPYRAEGGEYTKFI